MSVLDFRLPQELEAPEPPEARGISRDHVRLLVGEASSDSVTDHEFTELPKLLRAGDVLVVNTSATIPAAISTQDSDKTVHFSTERADGSWLVELRQANGKTTEPYSGGTPGDVYRLPGNASITLRERYSRQRLWVADVRTGAVDTVQRYLRLFGSPIRYSYVREFWPISYYQTVFGIHPGSAEMPSASRPFTNRLVTRLAVAGIQFAPILLHTGVASPEAHERPYPERFAVSSNTARIVNQAKAAGGRIIAVGTTAVRALESATNPSGIVSAASGFTDLIITPERGVRTVDGLLTGFHEPQASHLDMLAAIADRELLARCYTAAIDAGYLWHEFGDLNLLLP